MRLLVLTCGGDDESNSAAFAAANEWCERGDACEVVDASNLDGEEPPRLVTSARNSLLAKSPNLFSRFYRAGGEKKLTSPTYIASALYARKLLAYIQEKDFDAVLCTHLSPMETLSHLRRRSLLARPCFGLLTGYVCPPMLAETALDTYFSPHESVTEACAARGMRACSFVNTGIPVHKSFGADMPRNRARGYLALPREGRIYLVMAGGLRREGVLQLCQALMAADSRGEVYVLTERGDALHHILKDKYGLGGRVHPTVVNEKLSVYMKAADVLVKQAGGTSDTEAAVAGVPMVHAACAQEGNAGFFAQQGMALCAGAPEEAAALAVGLAEDEAAAQTMRAAQARNVNPNAAADIVARMKNACRMWQER